MSNSHRLLAQLGERQRRSAAPLSTHRNLEIARAVKITGPVLLL